MPIRLLQKEAGWFGLKNCPICAGFAPCRPTWQWQPNCHPGKVTTRKRRLYLLLNVGRGYLLPEIANCNRSHPDCWPPDWQMANKPDYPVRRVIVQPAGCQSRFLNYKKPG